MQYTSQLLDKTYIESTQVPSKDMDIVYFEIFICQFTNIEYFDFTHLFTDEANHEYESRILTNNTDEILNWYKECNVSGITFQQHR